MTSRLYDGRMSAMPKTIKQLVEYAKKKRVNRVYYDTTFKIGDLRRLGIVQCDEKSLYDQVALDGTRNESIEFYGFDQRGSRFQLSITICSLYTNVDQPENESRWRVARVEFCYINSTTNKCKYTYECEQLIDYEYKRANSTKRDCRTLLKIGSISIETVLPFSLTRILFNGVLRKDSLSDGGESSLVSAKFTISTHPTCDKFDYRYRFSINHVSNALREQVQAPGNTLKADQLLAEVLEDRIDQTMMFQGHLELFETHTSERFVMWGAKLKRFLDPCEELQQAEPVQRECLYVWTELGHWIHLTRPISRPHLIYGMINNSYEYASPLYDAKYVCPKSVAQTDEQPLGLLGLEKLKAFAQLEPGAQLVLKGYKKKLFTMKVLELTQTGLMRITMNSFEGWATLGNAATTNLAQTLREAQQNLWALSIEPERRWLDVTKLASEKLLGGKGNSLVELNKLIKTSLLHQDQSTSCRVSVPRGIIVTCTAYRLWLLSNPSILGAIDELDTIRLTLAASTTNTNPLSEFYIGPAEVQRTLKDHCRKVSTILRSCPLPSILKEHLRSILLKRFTHEELPDTATATSKTFAVRSSAVGEDSLETSAAGQMRTILDARGFQSICRAVVDCWSSQFEIEALSYKSQNGLALNLPMAVVVQELIQCDTAGVATTCDPLTGNKKRLEILANKGLGEAVVSGGAADTIRISLGPLGSCVEKMGDTCCLTDEQIGDLTNLLIKLRKTYDIQEREIEWGITAEKCNSSSSSTSSSSSSSDDSGCERNFHIHLLQSRPLTHLNKLSTREIDHELDHGFSSPWDLVTRANLGEVMPGLMCPLTMSYFLDVCPNINPHKPFERDHTFKTFTATSFGSYGRMICMILTHSDLICKFELGNAANNSSEASSMQLMVGTTHDPDLKSLARIVDINREKRHPLSLIKRDNLLTLLSLDLGALRVRTKLHKRSLKSLKLIDHFEAIESGSRLSMRWKIDTTIKPSPNSQRPCYDPVMASLRESAVKLFDRLCKSSDLLIECWRDHMYGTMLSMAFNMICLKIMEKQPAYGGQANSDEMLNDFSVLIRGGPMTESGDISCLLDELIVAWEEEGKLGQVTKMNHRELYQLLTEREQDKRSKARSSQLFKEFLAKNGHRAFKEFDFATLTWAADPSYIMKSLAARLRHQLTPGASFKAQLELRRQNQAQKLREETEAVLAKVTDNGRLLTSYVLPRARNAMVRREKTKSRLILAVDKYRKAFRHLGGLLCLDGRLPDANLVFQLTIEELDRVVRGEVGEMSGILYKARRRMQRTRALNQATFPKPTLDFEQMVEFVGKFSEDQAAPSAATTTPQTGDNTNLVRGMTSCAGCVTGRACVVSGPEDMDQIEPNDILITYSIDTSWSVYFFTLAGIVTEVGGIVSHGAVVAREYGIPTLCTAIGACSKFKTGQMVTLNANQGICYLAHDAESAATGSCADETVSGAAAAATATTANGLSVEPVQDGQENGEGGRKE